MQLDALTALQASRKEIDLRPRPGKLKSTVYAPDRTDGSKCDTTFDSLDPSDDDLLVLPASPSPSVSSQPAMVDLDSSDTEP